MARTEISHIEESKQPASLVARLLIQQGAREKAVEVLVAGLQATVNGKKDMPDHRTRRDSAMGILAYTDGRPIEMVYQVTEKRVTAPSAADLLRNPATLEAIGRQIASDPEVKTAFLAALKGLEPATDT